MWTKVIIVLLVLASVGLLIYAAKDFVGSPVGLAKRLTLRMFASVLAFIIVIAAYYLGWIHPYPLGG